MANQTIVTKQSMIQSLQDTRPGFVAQYIGKALVAIFERQTESEKQSNTTDKWNTIGFAGCDAKSGSITAKYFIKHHTLLDWQIEQWTRDYKGSPRITKYHRQLNEIALEKQALKQTK